VTHRYVAALLLAGALLLRAPAIADAHTVLVSSEPAGGSHLPATPARIRLVFSEPLEPALARVALVGSDGRSAPLVVAGDPHDVHAIVAATGGLPPGAYRVAWRVVSADGHPVAGSFVFSVGSTHAAPAPAGSDSAGGARAPAWGPTVLDAPAVPAALRGLAMGASMALAGLLLFMCWPRDLPAPASGPASRVANWLACISVVLLTLHLLAWLMNAIPEHDLSEGSIMAMLTSRIWQVELWRAGLGLLALWALVLARHGRLALCCAFGALAVGGASGHSAAIHPLWATPAKALHLVAGAAWMGGMLWLLLLDRRDIRAFTIEARRVSAVALGSVALVTLSGIAQTLMFLPSVLDLFRSPYGLTVVAKVVGLLVLVGIGAHHRYRVMPGLEQDAMPLDHFRATLRGEVAVMTLVVLLGGLLAYVPTPVPAEVHPATSHLAAP
jgi:copper transport protein